MNISIRPNHFKALAANTAKGDTRYYLCGIHVDTDNKKAVATDGHAMVVVPFYSEDSDGVEDCIFKLPPKLPDTQTSDVLIDISKHHAVITYVRKNENQKYTVEIIDGTFPKYQHLLEPEKMKVQVDRIGVNPELISRITKALGVKHVAVNISAPDQKMFVDFPTEPDVNLVVMPTRT